ncbi:TIM barrel protein [Bacillus infantis]|uniref:sugar phosphate isomerase/epimerase family protein n=1 Tax=Bacillus infantis TaxID=324767 RepID=UPI001CD751DB|nr:TIM barrel protein [Bacillus infantis]MCA1033580.1 TIM barrel protein [Bacillus infantis]
MKLAGMNITFRHYPFKEFLECMTSLDIRHIELWAGEPHFYVYRNLPGHLRSMKRELRSRKMELVCFTPEQCVYPYNIAASDSDWRRSSVEYFKDNLYAALELDCNMMLITSGIGDHSVSTGESWDYAADSIHQLAKIAEKEGMNLVLEPLTRFETNLVMDVEGVKRMLEDIRSSSLTGMIDTVAMKLAEETPEDYFSALRDVKHFHLIDGDGVSDAHLALDDGVLDWRGYMESLESSGYKGACTLEIMGSDYYKIPKEIVSESVKKLRELESFHSKTGGTHNE